MPRPTLRIESPGMLTTVQDLGRPHLRYAGLPSGGAADAVSLRTANLLVGNAENAAALECALVGPAVRFSAAATVAITGARVAGLPWCERFHVKAGGRFDLSRFQAGAYAYVAVVGGLIVPEILGGRGTDVRLSFGGVEGRALRAGDVLAIEKSPVLTAGPALRVASLVPPDDAPVRIIDGKDARLVRPAWIAGPYTVSSKSDRVGVRLDGPKLSLRAEAGAASAVVLPGTIQLPGDGVPIVLLADAQTLGGYPQIAHVISADLPRVAQIRPGRAVRFVRVTLAEAHRAARAQDRAMAFFRYGIRQTIGP